MEVSEASSLLDSKVNVVNDSSSAEAGIIANNLANEFLRDEDQQDGAGGEVYGSVASEQADGEDDDEGYAVPKKKLYIIAGSIFMGSYLSALDTTVVTTLLTVISSDLNCLPQSSWIATSYLLSCSAFQPLFGKLSDIFGRKELILLCNFCFALGCILCGISGSLFPLIVGRFITGIGGGGMTSLGTVAMSDLVSLRKSASGGVLGGLIADRYGWKWVFIFQVPLALIGAALIYFFMELPKDSPGRGLQGHDIWEKLKKVDFLGSSLLVIALIGILSAASFGGSDIAYDSLFFKVLVATSVAALVAFCYVEANIAEQPTLPVRLLANRSVLACSLANWFFTMGTFSYFYYIPVWFSSVLGLNSTQTGLRFVPNFFSIAIGSLGSGIYMRKTGRYKNLNICIGLVSVCGVLRLCFINPSISVIGQYSLTVIPGIGYSSMLTISLLALISAVTPEQQASTTSIQYAFRATGSTLGVSIGSAIFQKKLYSNLTHNLMENVPIDVDKSTVLKIISKAFRSSEYVDKAPEWSKALIRDSYSNACIATFWWSFITITVGYLSGCFIREYKLHATMKRTNE
ncbi:hypothetical protein PACTADRAFT_1192 [Pachysolen tannophilus NRRL Y-2460]|uniref:Major facilitator superfamily (MFS) profile domain-containing protein n=1 Tax=Pachysolen tannophilus NRRL Y-2460 TaxID=669874 RepID=A0A1E4TXV6_PACTA|nr:hypothetical protein PACTADRAFT_1192 [Pachysolen tannophilus NRRL Y-2460]